MAGVDRQRRENRVAALLEVLVEVDPLVLGCVPVLDQRDALGGQLRNQSVSERT